jgi:hypothetical protein
MFCAAPVAELERSRYFEGPQHSGAVEAEIFSRSRLRIWDVSDCAGPDDAIHVLSVIGVRCGKDQFFPCAIHHFVLRAIGTARVFFAYGL